MRNLSEIIGKLSKEEKRHFKIYLNRIKLSGDKQHKAALLFDLVNQTNSNIEATKSVEQNDDEWFGKLYSQNGDKNAYYQLKNRLLGDLERSWLLLHSELSDRIHIMTRIAVAELYVHKSLYKEAYDILRQLERKATKAGHYDLLAVMYDLIVKMAFTLDSINLEQYMGKQIQNLEHYKEMLQTDHLIKTLSYRLIRSNFEARDAAIEQTLNDIQATLQIQKDLFESPKMQLEIHNTVRRILLQKQDYAALETYLIDGLQDLENKQIFKKDTHVHKIVSLVWILNTLLKNRKFQAMPTYSERLLESLQAYGKLYYDKYIWTYNQCVITQHFYSNELEKAAAMLENLIAQASHVDGSLYYETFTHANISVIYYCQGQLRKAMTKLTPLLQKDTFNKQSPELQLRVGLLEIILHFENNDFTYIDYRINDLRHSYKDLLKQEAHQRESQFIKIMRKCINSATPFKDERITKIMQQFIAQAPDIAPGSNEFINYSVWLTAKINRKLYYEVLLSRATQL